jgi:hypothetical protein
MKLHIEITESQLMALRSAISEHHRCPGASESYIDCSTSPPTETTLENLLGGLMDPSKISLSPQIAQQDPELLEWILGIANDKPVTAGGFLHSLAHMALRADEENYPIFRPALREMKKKYPQYKFTEADSLAEGERFP